MTVLDIPMKWGYTYKGTFYRGVYYTMHKLHKYLVPVELTVYGETELDAIGYVQDALDHSDILDQDGILGVNPDIEVDDIELLEEDM
jgi:hypothetical protein